jgi:hypothetical protein
MAAVRYVEGKDTQPPYELRMAYQIERWGDPFGGGWMEWDARLLARMQTVKAYADAFKAYKDYSGQKGFVGNNPSVWRLVTEVWKWRKDAGLDWW